MQAQQNFLWLPFGGNRNPVMNLGHSIPTLDTATGQYMGRNGNCETKYVCLPVAREYSDAELLQIAHIANCLTADPSKLEGREWWILHARHADTVAMAIEKFEA